tara:strand:- start:49 stop:1437 length:1389 start_codon:yes stop_codon:yes gene_type:complete
MTNITKIKNAIKRKVNERRLRNTISNILDDSLPNILAEIDQLDQAFLDAKPVKEGGTPLQNKVYDAVTGMSVNGKDSFESKFAVRSGKLNDFVFRLSDRDATGILKLIKQRKFESIKELDVRKTHGDKRIENPATGNDIKLRTALKAKKGSAVYAKGKSMYNALKDKPANEGKLSEVKIGDMVKIDKAYGGGKGKVKDKKGSFVVVNGSSYHESDVKVVNESVSKLTEAEDYKYKKQVAKAFDKINDEMFKFRHSMGLKQLTNKDRKLKDKVESLQMAIFDLQKEMKKDGLTEGKLTEAKLRKGDLVGVDDEIGVVNKVKGRVAYIKLPSMPGSFHPIEVETAKYKGKFKGKDIYISEGKVNEADYSAWNDKQLLALYKYYKGLNMKKAVASIGQALKKRKVKTEAITEERLNEGSKADRWFDNLKYYYEKGLSSPDLKDPAEKKAYTKLAKQFFSKLREGN